METESSNNADDFSKKRKFKLPPVQRPPEYFHDQFEHSFLKTFDLRKQNEAKLTGIM